MSGMYWAIRARAFTAVYFSIINALNLFIFHQEIGSSKTFLEPGFKSTEIAVRHYWEAHVKATEPILESYSAI